MNQAVTQAVVHAVEPTVVQPGTWPQVVVVAVFLFLFALPALAIHPTLRKDGARLVTYLGISGAAAFALGLTALDMDTYGGWAALGLLLYALWILTGAALSIRARRQYHRIKRRRKADAEVLARMEADLRNPNGPTL